MSGRVIAAVAAAVLLSLLCAGAPAEDFSLRDGITWGMQEEEIAGILAAEPEADRYSVLSVPWEDGTLMPLEDKYHQVQALYVLGADPDDAYDTMLIFVCTKKDGLYEVLRMISPRDGAGETVYSLAQRQVLQLAAEYGPFTGHEWDMDLWEKRDSLPVGEYVFINGTRLSDGTVILVMMDKAGESAYSLWVEYQSADCMRIEQMLTDGSYYEGLEPAE